MPGGAEMIVLAFILIVLFTFPVLTIVLFLKNRSLKQEIDTLSYERDELRRKFYSSEKSPESI